MNPQLVHYVPLATTIIALVFAWTVLQRWRERRSGPHLLWWAAGVMTFAVGTFTEGFVTLFGWNAFIFRSWYIAGALAALCVLASPLDLTQAEPFRLSGDVLVWYWVRLFSPFINTYALIYLVGGAILSAYRFRTNASAYHRFVGNVYIAVGAVLPAIGGSFTRFGYTEVLYVTELVGLIFIYIGYRYNVR